MFKKIIAILAVVVVLVGGIVFVPRLVHTCDDCGDFFVGTGYNANVASDFFADDEQIICRKCAEKQHAISITLGKSVNDFKRELFD